MTPRERSGAVWDMFTLDLMAPGNRPPVTVERVILAIEQAIIAVIEAEREACAQIAEAYHADCALVDCEERRAVLRVAEQIRARSQAQEEKGD